MHCNGLLSVSVAFRGHTHLGSFLHICLIVHYYPRKLVHSIILIPCRGILILFGKYVGCARMLDLPVFLFELSPLVEPNRENLMRSITSIPFEIY